MTGDPVERLGLTPQSLALASGAQGDAAQPSSTQAAAADLPAGSPNYFIVAEDDPVLPDQVAAVPTLQSGEARVVTAFAPTSTETQARLPAAAQPAAEPQTTASTGPAVLTESQSAALEQRLGGEQPQQAAAVAEQARPQQVLTNPTVQQVSDDQTAARPQKRGIFASLFARRPQADVGGGQRPVAADTAAAAQMAFAAASAGSGLAAPSPAPRPAPQEQEVRTRQPLVTLASTGPAAEQNRPRALYSDDALPGVRQGALFEIKRRSGLDDDADIDLYEDEEVKVASAAGLARLAPNGLLRQTDNVDVACLKPSLVRVLKTIESHYGKKLVVTSGYRSPPRNRSARGAKNSLHMYCAAADVQVEGVGKWELAQFVRSMPGRGGVGTYCHTNSVHVDVGPERDWNWRCRRRK